MASKKEDAKAVSAPVSYAGDSIQKKILRIGLLLISIGLIKGYIGNYQSGVSSGNQPICGDAVTYRLSSGQSVVEQKVHKDCLSGLIFSPDISAGKIGIDAPGSVSICLWNRDRCVGWVHTENDNSQEMKKNEIPEYSAIRLIGDEGVATLRLR